MAYQSMREWIAKLEEEGELKRVTAEVDWNLELGAIARRVADMEGPALLFENIKGCHDTRCRKLFLGGPGSRQRVALALGLPKETGYKEMVEFVKNRLETRVETVKVASGPVKENIVRGDDVDLYQLPVPLYHEMDGGRYINTYCSIVTMDPDTKLMNVGMYRGMIGDDEKSIAVLLVINQHWGMHFTKHKRRGEEMPVAAVYGWDPTLLFYSGTGVVHTGCSEYELVGGLRGKPVELVKCETSDLYVPATAEIVVEGRISPDPKTFQMEGPFGEFPGFYAGTRQPKPVIHVDCITHRNDPIFRGGLSGMSPGHPNESMHWGVPVRAAVMWRSLEIAGLQNVTGVWGCPIANLTNVRVQIDKSFRGQAKQVASMVFGIPGASQWAKNLVVVDKDIDIFDDAAVEWAVAYRTNAAMNAIQFFPGTQGNPLDPSTPLSERDVAKYGTGKWTRVFVDATVNWDLEPEEQFGGGREPPLCTVTGPETAELVSRRWHEYGF
jgi:UbiD family decarboxylase